MTRYAIGDIQGCMTTLERLLLAIDYKASDELWLAGDLVNRGPRSLDVLHWAKKVGATVVLGNHDLHLLSRAAGASAEKKRDTLGPVLAAPELTVLLDWLRAQPLLHHDDRHALVHAGLHPRWTIAHARDLAAEIEAELRGPRWKQYLASPPDRLKQHQSYFVRVRTILPDGRMAPDFDGPPDQAPKETLPWYAAPDPAWATHKVIFGHWAAAGLQLGANHAGLDTGCVWGRSLTAMRMDDGTITQVKARD